MLSELSARIAALEKIIQERLPGLLDVSAQATSASASASASPMPVALQKHQVTPLLSGMDVCRQCPIGSLSAVQTSSDTASILQGIINSSIAIQPLNLNDSSLAQHPQKHESIPSSGSASSAASGVAEEEEEEEEVEGEEEAEGEEEEAEGEEEEEEEEDAVELDEFEYKGVTYFKDSENQVYQVDADGDLDDTPIGVWSEEKGKILKYAKA